MLTRCLTCPRNRRFACLAAWRLCRLVHAARLDGGATLQTFQAGDLLALLANDFFQGGDFAEQFNQQNFKLWTA
jgi:hypothetical protein